VLAAFLPEYFLATLGMKPHQEIERPDLFCIWTKFIEFPEPAQNMRGCRGIPAGRWDAQDPRLELAARELTKLKPDDLDRLLKLLAAMRSDPTPNADGGDR
jgi:hypothetical protein